MLLYAYLNKYLRGVCDIDDDHSVREAESLCSCCVELFEQWLMFCAYVVVQCRVMLGRYCSKRPLLYLAVRFVLGEHTVYVA